MYPVWLENNALTFCTNQLGEKSIISAIGLTVLQRNKLITVHQRNKLIINIPMTTTTSYGEYVCRISFASVMPAGDFTLGSRGLTVVYFDTC